MTFTKLYEKHPHLTYYFIYGSTWLIFLISFSRLLYQLINHHPINWWWLSGMIIPTILQTIFWQWLMAHLRQ